MEDQIYDFIRSVIIAEGFCCLCLFIMCKIRYWKYLGDTNWRASKFPWAMVFLGLAGLMSILYPIVTIIGKMGSNTVISHPTVFGFLIFSLGIWGLVIWYNELREQIGRDV